MLIASIFNIFNICVNTHNIKEWLLKMVIVKKSLQYIYNIDINYQVYIVLKIYINCVNNTSRKQTLKFAFKLLKYLLQLKLLQF